jgi:hypothetical protein
MMTPHHVFRYLLVAIKNGYETVEIHPNQDNCTRRRMSETHASPQHHYEPGTYKIRLKGHLDDRWADWFDGLAITLEENGDTLLTGPVVDQAALHGLLKKVRDLGMPLISVSPVEHGPTTALGTGQSDQSDFK